MLKGISPEEYIRKVDEIERMAERDHAFFESIRERVTDSLLNNDMDALLAVSGAFSSQEGREASSRYASLLQLRFMLGAIEKERALSIRLFSEDLRSFDELIDKHMEINLLLRRIEFDIIPGKKEALLYISDNHISPYAVAGIVYGMTSSLGHREKIFLEIAEHMLSEGRVLEAYGFLTVIEQPSEDTKLLCGELADVIRGGAV